MNTYRIIEDKLNERAEQIVSKMIAGWVSLTLLPLWLGLSLAGKLDDLTLVTNEEFSSVTGSYLERDSILALGEASHRWVTHHTPDEPGAVTLEARPSGD